MCYLSGTHVTIGVVSTGPCDKVPMVTRDMQRQAEQALKKRVDLGIEFQAEPAHKSDMGTESSRLRV